MDIYDIVITILYLFIAYFFGFVISSFNSGNELYKKYFMKGLSAKLWGGLGFALVYTYYYTYGGDTMAYYHDASLISNYFFKDPLDAIQILWNPSTVQSANSQEIVRKFVLVYTGSEFPVVRAAAILNLIGLNSFYSTTIVFAAFSYFGVWHFFLVFAKRYPQIANQLAIAILFVPSVFFWGSGIMKDSLVIGYLGLMVYAIDKYLTAGVKRFFWALLILVCAKVVFSVKAYVIMALVPALVIWVVLNAKDRIKNSLIRALIVPFLLFFSMFGMYISISVLGKYQDKYSVDNFFDSANSMQGWHYKEGANTSDQHGRGSSYTLGDYDPSLVGTLKVFPAAVNVTFFRPYFWEVKNAAMFISAIESFVMLIFAIFIFIGLGFFRVLRLLAADPFLLMSLTFAIFFAFAVGFTSYNFGALARYKIPCIPFFVSSLLILNFKVKEIKMKRKVKSNERKRSIR
jgi:hypothetical protein